MSLKIDPIYTVGDRFYFSLLIVIMTLALVSMSLYINIRNPL